MFPNNIRILVLPSGFPTLNSPFSGTFNRDHIDLIKRTGAFIEVIYVDFGKSNSSRRTQNYVFNHCNIPLKRRKIFYPCFFFAWFIKIFTSFLMKKPDLIIAYSQKWAGFIAGLTSVITNVPLIFVNHASKPGHRLTFRGFIDFFLAIAAHSIWFVSPAQERSFKKRFPLKQSLIMGNPIDTQFFIPLATKQPEVPKILFVGRPTYSKGIDILIDSLRILRKKDYDFHLTVLEDTTYRSNSAYKSFLEELSVTILPYVRREDYLREIQNSSFLILPSRYESFSLVLAEAISCGIPVVSTQCGGPEWFVTEKVGVLSEPDNVESFADALIYMLNNYQNYDPWKLHQHIVDRFSYDVVEEKMVHCISEILNK
jgi:glycosyltransferase involved in cell wall biosynthesis